MPEVWNPSVKALNIAESDALRSDFVRTLLQNRNVLRSSAGMGSIPKTIIHFWNDLPSIPDDVKGCLDSWARLERDGYFRFVFDERSAATFIAERYSQRHLSAFNKCYHPAMKSDYFRLCFIYAQGGCYVDADDTYTGRPFGHLFDDDQLKLQPLCYDCESHFMVDPVDFRRGEDNLEHRIYYFNNNPIIAAAGDRIVGYALRRATRQLLQSLEPYPEIQSTTGPGNMTASVVARCATTGEGITSLMDWGTHSQTVWSLSYRGDSRNWRISNRIPYKG